MPIPAIPPSAPYRAPSTTISFNRATNTVSGVVTAPSGVFTGFTVYVAVDGLIVGTATPNGSGAWSYTIPGLTTAPHRFNVQVNSDSLANVPASTLCFPNFKAAVASVRAGTAGARARWGMVGDSITAGWGSSATTTGGDPGATGNSLRSKSWPAYIAAQFTAAGIKCRSDAVWGHSNVRTLTTAAYNVYNPDVTFDPGWAIYTTGGGTTVGAYFFTLPASTSGNMTFTPEVNADSIDVYYAKGNANGAIQVSDSTGVLAFVDCYQATPTTGFGKITVKRTAASSKDPFVVNRYTGSGVNSTTAAVYIVGLVPYDSTTASVELWNMGWAGSKVSDWLVATNGFNPLPVLKTLVADLWSIELGANDSVAAVDPTTYQTNLSTLLSAVGTASVSDKMLIESHPANPTTNTFNLSAAYRAAMVTLSNNNNLIQPPDFSGAGLATSDYVDAIHLFASGYSKEAAYLFPLVAAQT